MEFFLKITPPRVTHQQKKIAVFGGKPRFYEPERLKDARRILMLSLAPHKPVEPLGGPLALTVRWQFFRRRGRAGWKVTRPDLDNMQKLLKDCMTDAGFWHDDAQVARETAEKVWAEDEGIFVKIWELDK